jgi:hypothetical protein
MRIWIQGSKVQVATSIQVSPDTTVKTIRGIVAGIFTTQADLVSLDFAAWPLLDSESCISANIQKDSTLNVKVQSAACAVVSLLSDSEDGDHGPAPTECEHTVAEELPVFDDLGVEGGIQKEEADERMLEASPAASGWLKKEEIDMLGDLGKDALVEVHDDDAAEEADGCSPGEHAKRKKRRTEYTDLDTFVICPLPDKDEVERLKSAGKE